MPTRSLLDRLVAPEVRAFRGEAPLARVFWLHGVAASVWLATISMAVIKQDDWPLTQAMILLDVGYTSWVLIAIWRCSANAQTSWGMLARWLTIAWALNAALVLFFMELELVLPHVAG